MLAGNRVIFTVQLPDGQGDRLYILDPRNGAVTASVTTGSATAPNFRADYAQAGDRSTMMVITPYQQHRTSAP